MKKKSKEDSIFFDIESDWIKFTNPIASLAEIYILEGLRRCKNSAERQIFINSDGLSGLTSAEQEEFLLKRLAEWNVELPYWWHIIKSQRLEKREPAVESTIENIRQAYQPQNVTILFVGESPPAGGTFFYQANSNLARYTQAAFANVFERQFETGEQFLRFFQSCGCYLVDLSLEPVNHLEKAKRRQVRSSCIPSLAKRIQAFQPAVVIVVMKDIQQDVEAALQQAGLESSPVYVLPFPALGNQKRYVSELSQLLQELKPKISILN